MPVVQICRYWKGMVVFMHNKTISYYNKNAKEFAKRTVNADMGFCYSKFTALLHNKDYILDAGCGSGRDSKFFLEQGFNVQAIDASMEMCQLAAEYIGIPVKCLRFDEIEFDSQFNGIWANASLLHIEKSSLPDILRKFNRALKPDGIMYASFKYGDKEEERLERFFSDYHIDELEEIFLKDGLFVLEESFETEDVRPDYKNKPGEIKWEAW